MAGLSEEQKQKLMEKLGTESTEQEHVSLESEPITEPVNDSKKSNWFVTTWNQVKDFVVKLDRKWKIISAAVAAVIVIGIICLIVIPNGSATKNGSGSGENPFGSMDELMTVGNDGLVNPSDMSSLFTDDGFVDDTEGADPVEEGAVQEIRLPSSVISAMEDSVRNALMDEKNYISMSVEDDGTIVGVISTKKYNDIKKGLQEAVDTTIARYQMNVDTTLVNNIAVSSDRTVFSVYMTRSDVAAMEAVARDLLQKSMLCGYFNGMDYVDPIVDIYDMNQNLIKTYRLVNGELSGSDPLSSTGVIVDEPTNEP